MQLRRRQEIAQRRRRQLHRAADQPGLGTAAVRHVGAQPTRLDQRIVPPSVTHRPELVDLPIDILETIS